MNDVHEVLVAARNLIAREGWLQDDLGERGRGYCMLGGLCAAFSGWVFGTSGPVYHYVNDRVPGGSMVKWNNTPGRTKDEVLAFFDEAIAATAPPPPEFDLRVPDHIAIVVEDIHARR